MLNAKVVRLGAVTGARFYFFTDPTLLAPQTPAQAYGPVGTSSGGKDRFRVTDLHQRKSGSSADVPAFAICGGLICAQADAGGTLSLILKPIEQPPFDFPFISYVIYKGIDPASLLISGNAGSGGTIDTSKAADNELIDSAQKTWASNGNSGDPTRECLGLHLTPTSTAVDYPDLDLSKYADAKAIDNLFYQGDTKFQLPLVRGGWRIGNFAAARFGMEILVEHIGYRPKIALARKPENFIEVPSLDSNSTYAPNDTTYFMHWHAKEECLNFVDPCAFWGSFFAARLRVWDGGNEDFNRKSGSDIYDDMIFGGTGGDQPGADGNFYNRNRAYLDIRNEHGHSINYYKADGRSIQLTLDAAADIDDSIVDYYASGWPSYWIDNASLPASATGDKAAVRLALPKTENTRPLLYVSAGYVETLERLKDPQRFIERPRRADQPFLEEAAIVVPLVSSSGTAKVIACYQKLLCFKRTLVVDGAAAQFSDPDTLAPAHAIGRDYFFPLPTLDELPLGVQAVQFKTYDDQFYLDVRTQFGRGLVARLAVGRDGNNVVLMMVPVAQVPGLPDAALPPVLPQFPGYVKFSSSSDTTSYVLSKLAAQYSRVTFADPDNSGTPVDAIRAHFFPGSAPSMQSALDDAAILVIGASGFASAAQSTAGAIANTVPIMFLEYDKNIAEEVNLHSKFNVMVTYLTAASQISRSTQPISSAGYADDRLYP